jgi:hypothetical protein
MDLNQLYSSANSFWDQISPIIYAHVFFLLAVRFIAGVRVPVRSTWNSLSGSDRYNEIKRMLEDLQVWSKLPYLLIVLLLFYFVLFSDLIGLLSLSRYTTVPYSPVELWVEFKPVDDLQTIGSFGENSKTSLENLSILKTSLLEAVMNSSRNSLGMQETEIAREPSRLWNPHFYAIFAQVHNTL